jgi:hypothetical protein
VFHINDIFMDTDPSLNNETVSLSRCGTEFIIE